VIRTQEKGEFNFNYMEQSPKGTEKKENGESAPYFFQKNNNESQICKKIKVKYLFSTIISCCFFTLKE